MLQPWDLYVGARLDVLGRPTTLMKASCETMTWLDRQAGLMMQRIKRLEADLAKFQPLSVCCHTHICEESFALPVYSLWQFLLLFSIAVQQVHTAALRRVRCS
jgi:hypothetical protein